MKRNILTRTAVFIMGLFIMALGVAFSIKADLGVSPISCIPYILSEKFSYSVGQMTILFNMGLILLQILLLRNKYKPFQLIQFPVVILFGFFTDFTLFLLSGLEITAYPGKVFFCLLSCALIGFGVFLEVKAKITYLAGEGVALALSETLGIEFGKAKIATDSTLVIIGAIGSLLFFHTLKGAREGTIIAALLVGFLARFYSSRIPLLNSLAPETDASDGTAAPASGEGKKVIITISREFGSGGHEIGERVSEMLGIPFYDRELIKLTAEESGFTESYVKEHEQRLAHALFLELYEQNYAYVNDRKPPLDALFMVQSKMIREISQRESCLIVGRCANFVLKDNPNSFNIFIHSPCEARKKRIEETGLADPELSAGELDKVDRERERYCRHFTRKEWNSAENYHLALDSSLLGIEESARIIAEAVRRRYNLNRSA